MRLGGPNAEVASYAWQIALNLSDAVWLAGMEDFDFLGACESLGQARMTINEKRSNGCARNILLHSAELFTWKFDVAILAASNFQLPNFFRI